MPGYLTCVGGGLLLIGLAANLWPAAWYGLALFGAGSLWGCLSLARGSRRRP